LLGYLRSAARTCHHAQYLERVLACHQAEHHDQQNPANTEATADLQPTATTTGGLFNVVATPPFTPIHLIASLERFVGETTGVWQSAPKCYETW